MNALSRPVLVKELPTVLDRVLTTAQSVDPDQLSRLQAQIKKYDAAIGTRLRIEQDAREKLQDKKLELLQQVVATKYPQLSLEALKMRDARGFPQLALFSPNAPESVITNSGEVSPDMPKELQDCYDDVIAELNRTGNAKLTLPVSKVHLTTRHLTLIATILGIAAFVAGAAIHSTALGLTGLLVAIFGGVLSFLLFMMGDAWPSETRTNITARYDGIVPDGIRQKMLQVKNEFDSVYFLAEVSNWKVNRIVIPRPDPLLVGTKHGGLFVIAKFDTTKLEDYVAAEFATNPDH